MIGCSWSRRTTADGTREQLGRYTGVRWFDPVSRAPRDTASGCGARFALQTYNEQYCHVLVEYPTVLVQQRVHDIVEI
jgi:hypothetical protein